MTEPQPITWELIRNLNELDDRVAANDTSNTKLFLQLFGHMIRFCPDLNQWYVWARTHWEPDVEGRVFELTEHVARRIREHADALPADAANVMGQHANRSSSEASRRRIVSMSRSAPRVIIRSEDLNEPDDTVTCPNGVVDLNTGELKPHDSTRMATACTLVDYEPDARSDLLDEWCATFMPDPADQRTLFAVLGRALRSGNDIRSLPLFLGHTTSGKSQLIGAVTRVLRGYTVTINASVFRGNLDDRPRPDLIRAVRSRIAFAHEAAQTWDMHGDHVKKLTGADTLPVRTLYQEQVEIRPTFTPIIIANEMPRVKGADEALRRRIVVVSFDRSLSSDQVDPRKRMIFENDPVTRRALLARIIAGARDTLDLTVRSERNVVALAEAFDEVDHVGQFISWALEQGHLEHVDANTPTSHCVKASDLHAWYVHWVRKHGDRSDRDGQMNMRAFGTTLRARGWEAAKVAGTRWVGWALKSNVPWL